jgi:hypothetical protein
MDVELKPCPFCGGKPHMSRRGLSEVHAYADEVKIQCGTCSVYRSAMGDTSKPGYADNSTVEARVIEKWNTRHGAGDADHSPDAGKMGDDRSAELTTAWMAGVERERDRAAERLRDLHDSIRTVYDTVPSLPIDETTMDAATDALHAFCLLVGIHKIDIDTPRDDAARAGERG